MTQMRFQFITTRGQQLTVTLLVMMEEENKNNNLDNNFQQLATFFIHKQAGCGVALKKNSSNN